MTRHFLSSKSWTRTVLAFLLTAPAAGAAEFPPPPPVAVLLAQSPAEPTPVAPVLPGLNPVLPAEPTPIDLPPADPNLAVPDADVEAFARGPVHEAFADVYDLNPAPSELVPQAPPAAVDELPPEQAPQGENVQWISGYWAWDLEAKDFLWVSGVWRDVPPGRRWVPGYWAEVTGGYQWVSGFWADAQMKELAYVPPPPESLEVGPNVPAPSDDHVWVPGSWTYVNANYSWSPGYYTVYQPNYMWVPSQYVWTPRGCVFVPGYMDYRFANRGLCFSPVRFRRPLYAYGYARPAWYRPRYAVSMNGFLIHLFVRPRCRNFWYGDYYGAQYASFGFTPWYRRTTVFRHSYDPAFNFYRWDSHRHGQNFVNNIDTWHRRYESNADLRPPRLAHDHDAFLARHQGDRAAQLALTTQTLDDVVKSHRGDAGFRQLDSKDLNVVRESHRATRELELARRQTEHDAGKIVDLKAGTDLGRDRLSIREGRVETARPERLKLNDLPSSLSEKTRESVARAERLREQAQVPARDDIRTRVDTARDHRNSSVGSERNPLGTSRTEKDHPSVTGNTDKPGASNIEALRQRLEDRRIGRETTGGNDAGTTRSLDRGKPQDAQQPKSNDLNAAQLRAQEIRQQAEVRRQEREVQRNSSSGSDSTPRHIERTPIERAPMERAPRMENIPRQVDQVPRHMERAPVERAPRQVEQAPRHIEQAPRHIERAPRQIEHAPRQIERAPREHAPSGGGSSRGHRKG